jgi:hypothetical protein
MTAIAGNDRGCDWTTGLFRSTVPTALRPECLDTIVTRRYCNVRIRSGVKLGGIALMITAGAVLGTAGPANAGNATIDGSSMRSVSGLNWAVAASNPAANYGGHSYTMMLSNGEIAANADFGLPYQVFTLNARTTQVGAWCGGYLAHVVVKVDDTTVIQDVVSTGNDWMVRSNHGKAQKFATGPHTIRVIYDNDINIAAGPNAVFPTPFTMCDVNLDVASIERSSFEGAGGQVD